MFPELLGGNEDAIGWWNDSFVPVNFGVKFFKEGESQYSSILSQVGYVEIDGSGKIFELDLELGFVRDASCFI